MGLFSLFSIKISELRPAAVKSAAAAAAAAAASRNSYGSHQASDRNSFKVFQNVFTQGQGGGELDNCLEWPKI